MVDLKRTSSLQKEAENKVITTLKLLPERETEMEWRFIYLTDENLSMKIQVLKNKDE